MGIPLVEVTTAQQLLPAFREALRQRPAQRGIQFSDSELDMLARTLVAQSLVESEGFHSDLVTSVDGVPVAFGLLQVTHGSSELTLELAKSSIAYNILTGADIMIEKLQGIRTYDSFGDKLRQAVQCYMGCYKPGGTGRALPSLPDDPDNVAYPRTISTVYALLWGRRDW